MEAGNFISDNQNRSFSKVAVLGSVAKTNLFGEEEAVGKTVKIKSNTYTIIGVAVAKGGTTESMSALTDTISSMKDNIEALSDVVREGERLLLEEKAERGQFGGGA